MRPIFFITGIPAAGKSYLGKKISKKTGGYLLEIDTLREKLSKNPKYRKSTNFYLDQDELAYYTNTNYKTQWQNLVKQSEALWPPIVEKIQQYQNGHIPIKSRIAARFRKLKSAQRPLIIEGVTMLPHLTHRDLSFPCVVLIGESYENIFARIKNKPRWGHSENLQKLEADAFWFGERPHYKAEAEKYGYPVFETADEAYHYILKMLKDFDS